MIAINCQCDERSHRRVTTNGCTSWLCTGCGAVTRAPRRGARVVDGVRFRDASEGITPALVSSIVAAQERRERAELRAIAWVVVPLLAFGAVAYAIHRFT